MKVYDKNNESLYRQYWKVNNVYGWATSQILPVKSFKWIKDTSQFNQDLINFPNIKLWKTQ